MPSMRDRESPHLARPSPLAEWSDQFTDDTGRVWQVVIDDAAEASIFEFLGIELREMMLFPAPAELDISKPERIPRIGSLIFLTCARESPNEIEEFSRRLLVPETFDAWILDRAQCWS